MANTSDSSFGVQQQCIPFFDGKDYGLWSFKMKTIFLSLDLWELVEKGYVEPDSWTTLTEAQQSQFKQQHQQKDASAFSKIQQGVSDSICRMIMEAATAKEAWDILQLMYQENVEEPDKTEDKEWIRYLPLYRAVDSGDWKTAEEFLKNTPQALTAIISGDGDTALHVAALRENVEIVQKLVNMMNPEHMAVRLTRFHNTALHDACSGGTIEIAKILVDANHELLSIRGRGARIPVVEAYFHGNKDMVHYIYSKTPKEALNSYRRNLLLYNCINAEIYDIALDLVKRDGMLANSVGTGAAIALLELAQNPSAFKSGSQLKFWQRWIYSIIWVQPPHALTNIAGDIESSPEGPTDRGKMITRVLNQLLLGISSELLAKVPAIRHMYDEKLKHVQAHQLLVCICKKIFDHDPSQLEKDDVYEAIVEATGNGIVEFINEIVKIYPNIIWKSDDDGRRIFNYAVLHRQEKIFSLLYEMGKKKNILAKKVDNDGNNMLHQAALLAPSSKLDRISGAALQMQRELQWFTEVILQPEYRKKVNEENKTPRDLFTEQHKKLVKEGEKWMKETATSCTFAAALIATIMFAAAFTVPGGYDDETGIPIYLHDNYFLIFIISDALSLFSSTISVLTLLAIRTCIAIQRRRFPQVLALEVNSCPFHPIVLYINNDDILRCYHCYCAS